MTNVQADLFQLLGHAWSAITAQAETRLFFDMRQRDHIRALSAASGATAMRPQAARADGHNPAHQIDGKCCSVLFNELKPHGFWLAKNTVAFLRNSHVDLGGQFMQIIAKRLGATLSHKRFSVCC